MGGRGSGSGLNTLAAQKTINDIVSYMQKEHGVTVDGSIAGATTTDQLRGICSQIEDLEREFPQIRNIPDAGGSSKTRDAVKQIGSRTMGNAILGEAGFNGQINLNEGRLQKGQTLLGTTNHEVGHLLERALILKNEPTRWAAMDAWNKCTHATRVVGEACKNLKRMPQYSGMKNDQFVRQVSNYAMTNRSEALAECVKDYRKNGANAKPLSQEVWKILKRELG